MFQQDETVNRFHNCLIHQPYNVVKFGTVHLLELILWFYSLVVSSLVSVFYVKRSSSSGSSHGLLWSLGRAQFSCPSRVLRDQWTRHLRAALKTHSKDPQMSKITDT